ncbi:MAG: winged helix-turn-helix transcriptional regulator [Methanomicrobiales archaeon]|nr:winged helix-turn-helix transcriptional regulator [Methanomicrobiales archaeon]
MKERDEETEPLAHVLRSKSEATRFQILVEIAENQPAVRQQEIAAKLGVTPQAVSEYIRELVEEGLVDAKGRGHYEVTRAGVEWVLHRAEALELYARHIRRDVIHQVSIWTALAAEDIRKGEQVGVYMSGGLLYAAKKPQSAMGIAAMDAKAGGDIGVERLSGLIDHREGTVHVGKVPRIERGGSRGVDRDRLERLLEKAKFVGAVGLEALVAIRSSGREPDMFFGAREGAIEAAFHGLDCAIVIVDEEFTDFLKRLEAAGLPYFIHELVIR